MDDELNLRHFAIHEAGHAVAHERLGIDQLDVTIKPDEVSGGSVIAEGEKHVLSKEHAEQMVLSLCAGYAALLASGFDHQIAELGANNDFERAAWLIDHWGLDGDFEEWRQKSVAMLSKPQNLAAIDHVANELLARETLDWDRIRFGIEFADGKITEAEYAQFKAFRDGSLFKK